MYKFAVMFGAASVVFGADLLHASDRGVRWGTRAQSLGPSVVVSSTNHTLDGQTAVLVEGGRSSLLPGAQITTVGVLNEINVVGDDNLVDATQTGTNTGDVTTNVTIAE